LLQVGMCMIFDCPKMIKLLLLLGCALCFIGCSRERHATRRFNAMGGLFSDWPEFAVQSIESNLLLGKQPVDPPSKYRDM